MKGPGGERLGKGQGCPEGTGNGVWDSNLLSPLRAIYATPDARLPLLSRQLGVEGLATALSLPTVAKIKSNQGMDVKLLCKVLLTFDHREVSDIYFSHRSRISRFSSWR